MSKPVWLMRILHKKRTFEELLFKFCFGDFNLHGLIYLLSVTSPVVCIVLYGCGEQRVDESSFPQARLASDLGFISRIHIHLEEELPTMIVKAAPRFATILCLEQVINPLLSIQCTEDPYR